MAAGTKRRGGQRPERVGEQIRQVLSDLLLSGAFKDERLTRADLVSFTEVRVTKDLRSARVFTSVFPSEPEVVEPVMGALLDITPRIRGLLARQIRLRHTPELRFTHDSSIERGARMEALLDEVRAEDRALADARGEGMPTAGAEEAGAEDATAPDPDAAGGDPRAGPGES